MILIGESIHVISRAINEAVQARNPLPIQDLARRQARAGADYLDLNLGALSRIPVETIQWVVNTVQEAVDLPLAIDTSNPTAMEAALSICRKPPLLNAATATQSSKETLFPLAKKYNADLVVLTFTDDGMPEDADARASCVLEVLEYADELGIPHDKIWVDAVLMPICVNQQQVSQYIEFLKLFPDVAPGARTITGLSNVSSCGVPSDLRQLLNHTLFAILKRHGQAALIADVLDDGLHRLDRGELPEVADLIYRAEDGEIADLDLLSDSDRDYVKTVDVLLGRRIYSHSWLE